LTPKERLLSTVLSNELIFFAKGLDFAYTLTLISTVLIIVSISTTPQLTTVMMIWLVLIGIRIVEKEL